MPIPLYYAANWKEIVNNTRIRRAQTGFGFYSDGSLRIPERILPGALCVIDDSALPAACAESVQLLAQYCKHGCCLDFERPITQAHRAFIRLLRQHTSRTEIFALPARFSGEGMIPVLSCPTPCNCWASFLRNAEARFPAGWMLEIVPWNQVVPYSAALSVPVERLAEAVCRVERQPHGIRYFDTAETLRGKLALAEAHRCIAAIGLYGELNGLPHG